MLVATSAGVCMSAVQDGVGLQQQALPTSSHTQSIRRHLVWQNNAGLCSWHHGLLPHGIKPTLVCYWLHLCCLNMQSRHAAAAVMTGLALQLHNCTQPGQCSSIKLYGTTWYGRLHSYHRVPRARAQAIQSSISLYEHGACDACMHAGTVHNGCACQCIA